MLNFFPTLYEDELFISAICRYRYRAGFRNIRSLHMSLYDRKVITKSAILPTNIDDFISKLPPGSSLSSDEIIMGHTLYPYYTAYLSQERSDEIFKTMKEGIKVSIERLLGFSGSAIKTPNLLKYCSACYEEDLKKYGESYWRRLNQIPGVYYCLRHEVILRTSNVAIHNGNIDYISATEACESDIIIDRNTLHYKKRNLEYARLANDLLNLSRRKSNAFIRAYYIDRLRERGWTSRNGNIRYQEFRISFIEYFSHAYLNKMQSAVDENDYGWLNRLFITTGKNVNPLRHLLLHQYLDLDVERLYQTEVVVGKIKRDEPQRIPIFSIRERREKWLKLIEENPHATRSDLRKLGKGLHTWIRKHDLEWYEKVTPMGKRGGKGRKINFEQRDKEMLKLVKKAHQQLLDVKGKPKRITPHAIGRELGISYHILMDERLVETSKYYKRIYEDNNDFRHRKVKWAINDMLDKNLKISVYKVQVYIGLTSSVPQEFKDIIAHEISKVSIDKMQK